MRYCMGLLNIGWYVANTSSCVRKMMIHHEICLILSSEKKVNNMAFSQDYSLSICMKVARGGSRVLFHDAKKGMTVRNDGYHFWGGQKQCVRGAYVAELPGRELSEELEEIANFSALSLGFANVGGQQFTTTMAHLKNCLKVMGQNQVKCMVSYCPYLVYRLGMWQTKSRF